MKKEDSPESALLFDWGRREHRGPWLMAYFLLTLLGLASLFVLFRIVTPEAPKLTTRPQQMIVLNPGVPAERALIHRAQDRSFTLVPSDTLGGQSIPSEARLPAFKSAISSFGMKLRSAGSVLTASDRPSLMEQDFLDALPPPTELEPVKKSTTPAAFVLRARLAGEPPRALLSGRDLKDIPLLDPARPRFRVAIGSLGQVVLAVPVASSEDPAVMVKLHAAMTQLRFQPQPAQKDLEWADVSFAWEKEAAP
jgi:hypothetical protein